MREKKDYRTSEQASQINIEHINSKLDKGFKFTQAAENQELVLMIGNTGAGKSTVGNYLLGHEMHKVEREVIDEEHRIFTQYLVESKDKEPTLGIGHNSTSETLYAKPVHSRFPQYYQWILTDCPGFMVNQMIEDTVVESISIELAVRAARQVKGILIVISLNVLKEIRVLELHNLMKTLISLFKNPVEMVKQSLFIINKIGSDSEDRAKNTALAAMNSLKAHCQKQIDILKQLGSNRAYSAADGLSLPDYQIIVAYFDELMQSLESVIVVNPLDSGESRLRIINAINSIVPRTGFVSEVESLVDAGANHHLELKPITIADFNFVDHDQNRARFNKAIYERSHLGHELMVGIEDS